jgi:Fur family ferric uptake transcriptional regulator
MTKARLPRISLGTVYRNLDLLVRQGEVLCLETAGARKRFDGNAAPHHHVRCRYCGALADLPGEYPLPSLEEIRVAGFSVTRVSLEFEGVCARCAA